MLSYCRETLETSQSQRSERIEWRWSLEDISCGILVVGHERDLSGHLFSFYNIVAISYHIHGLPSHIVFLQIRGALPKGLQHRLHVFINFLKKNLTLGTWGWPIINHPIEQMGYRSHGAMVLSSVLQSYLSVPFCGLPAILRDENFRARSIREISPSRYWYYSRKEWNGLGENGARSIWRNLCIWKVVSRPLKESANIEVRTQPRFASLTNPILQVPMYHRQSRRSYTQYHLSKRLAHICFVLYLTAIRIQTNIIEEMTA